VAAAVKYARRLPAGKVVVVLLPDTGRNYLSKVFSNRWLKENGYLDLVPEIVLAGDVLKAKQAARVTQAELVYVHPLSPAISAVRLMEHHGISQLPVLEDGVCTGSVNEVTLIKLLRDGVDLRNTPVGDVMGRPLPQVDASTDVSEVYRLLLAGNGGVLVTQPDGPIGILARIDLVEFWVRDVDALEAAI
jgi:cystathionine beta-synthase